MRRFLLTICFLLIATQGFCATQLKKTVCPSGCDYTALETCMNANEQNLVTADQYLDVEISGDWSGGADTTNVTIHNYTTDSTRYINIYTTGSARHAGVYSTSKYLLKPTSTSTTTLYCGITSDTGKTTIDGLIIDGSNITSSWVMVVQTNLYGANFGFKNNIVVGNTGIQGHSGVFLQGGRGSSYIRNNIVYNFTGLYASGIRIETSNSSTRVDNNTVYNTYRGLDAYSADGYVYNNAIMSCSSQCIKDAFQLNGGSNNITSDATGDDSPLTGGLINYTTYADYFVSVTGGSEDFHVKDTDSALYDAGADLSGTFTTDIDGDTRSQWDIGADEYVAAAAGVTHQQIIWW